MLEVETFMVSIDGKRGVIYFTDGSYKNFDSPSGQVIVYMFAWLNTIPTKQVA